MRHRGAKRSGRLPVELIDKAPILAALGQCREAVCRMQGRVPIGCPAYVAGSTMLGSIDRMAEILTGDPRHFHARAPQADTAFKAP